MNYFIQKKQKRIAGKWLISFFLMLFLTSGDMLAQINEKIQVTGKVIDQIGEPIIGGNIFQKGTSNGTITDVNGNFSLEIPQGSVITIRYLGYVSKEITVTDAKPLTITLKEDVQKINEVVVI
ncbi:TonB-dependent receptor SusC, partial [termite gut metagenome]